MHTLLKYNYETMLLFAITRTYYSALVVCKQWVVLTIFFCKANWPENSQSPIDKQK